MQDIWYCFERATGEYAGSGTPHIDNATHGSTLVPCPGYEEGEVAIWDGEAWSVVPYDDEG
jgi:hypothetical protein